MISTPSDIQTRLPPTKHDRIDERVCHGATVRIGAEFFEVGGSIPELHAFDPIQDGCRSMTVRVDVLMSIVSGIH